MNRRLLSCGILALTSALVCGRSVMLGAGRTLDEVHRPLPAGAIDHIMVIDLENESFSATFGSSSPAHYLNDVLLAQGELVTKYSATSHVSLGNYVSQVSGQAPKPAINNDCLDLASLSHPPLVGGFTDVEPGTDAADQAAFPGKVVGNGCVYPAPGNGSHGAQTIGDQLDARYPESRGRSAVRPWVRRPARRPWSTA